MLYSGKVVLFGQCGCVRAKVVVCGQKFIIGKSGYICARQLYLGISVVFGQKWL